MLALTIVDLFEQHVEGNVREDSGDGIRFETSEYGAESDIGSALR